MCVVAARIARVRIGRVELNVINGDSPRLDDLVEPGSDFIFVVVVLWPPRETKRML